MTGRNFKPDLSVEHRNKWANAGRFLRAKKCVDSVLYIGDLIKPPSVNLLGACNIDIFEYVFKLRRTFYIECGILLDELCKSVNGGKKRLCSLDQDARDIYYERDKNSAHADSDYRESTFNNLTDMAGVMKRHMKCVRRNCDNILPTCLRAEYVSFDPMIARIMHGVSPEKELAAKKRQHPFYDTVPAGCTVPIRRRNFVSLGQLNDVIADPGAFCVTAECGLFAEEALQNLQDFCVRANILCGYDMWFHKGVTFDKFKDSKLVDMGMADEFGKPVFPSSALLHDLLLKL